MLDPARPFDLTFRVDPAHDGLRLDRYVRAMAPTISRTRIQQYNAAGRILLGGAPRPDNTRVRAGDVVVLRCREPEGGVEVARDIPVDIVYEDEHLLAVNKQPGLVVHPVSLHRHDTLMNALYFRYKDRLPEGKELSLVNRIDKLTSGLVLVAKGLAAKRDLQEQFEARTPYKTYLAVARGLVGEEQGEIALPIGPKENRVNRCLQDIRRDSAGKPSLTRFWVRDRFPGRRVVREDDGGESREGFTLLRLALATGRQHQIRVHLKAVGHPLAGDHLYGDDRGLRWGPPPEEEDDDTSEGCGNLERFALHAETLTVRHPATGEELFLAAPPPADMTGLLAALRTGRPLVSFPLDSDAGVTEDDPADDAPSPFGRVPAGEHEFDRL